MSEPVPTDRMRRALRFVGFDSMIGELEGVTRFPYQDSKGLPIVEGFPKSRALILAPAMLAAMSMIDEHPAEPERSYPVLDPDETARLRANLEREREERRARLQEVKKRRRLEKAAKAKK